MAAVDKGHSSTNFPRYIRQDVLPVRRKSVHEAGQLAETRPL